MFHIMNIKGGQVQISAPNKGQAAKSPQFASGSSNYGASTFRD